MELNRITMNVTMRPWVKHFIIGMCYFFVLFTWDIARAVDAAGKVWKQLPVRWFFKIELI